MTTPMPVPTPVGFVGIDVGRSFLDLASSVPGTRSDPVLPRRVENTEAGIARAVAALTALGPELVVLEATGAYHRPLVAALVVAGIPTAVANPAQVAAFRQARLGREKSDAADAKLLVAFAATHGHALRRAEPADPLLAQLRAHVTYRDTLVAEQTRLKHRIHANDFGGDPTVGAWLAKDLAQLQTRLREVDAAIARQLTAFPEATVLRELRGVVPAVAATMRAASCEASITTLSPVPGSATT